MFDKMFIYEVEESGAKGVVIADTKEEAENKVIEAYKGGGYGEDFNFSELKVWKPCNGELLSSYPDVLEVTE